MASVWRLVWHSVGTMRHFNNKLYAVWSTAMQRRDKTTAHRQVVLCKLVNQLCFFGGWIHHDAFQLHNIGIGEQRELLQQLSHHNTQKQKQNKKHKNTHTTADKRGDKRVTEKERKGGKRYRKRSQVSSGTYRKKENHKQLQQV